MPLNQEQFDNFITALKDNNLENAQALLFLIPDEEKPTFLNTLYTYDPRRPQYLRSFLSLVAAHGDQALCKLLVDHGANINLKDTCTGYYPLAMALVSHKYDIFYFLANQHADMSILPGHWSLSTFGPLSLLQIVLQSAQLHYPRPTTEDMVKIVNFLIQAGIDINHPESENGSALNVAVYHGQVEVVRILLENGADVNITTRLNITPLKNIDWFLLNNADEGRAETMTRLLLDHGAITEQTRAELDIKRTNFGPTNPEAYWKLLDAEIQFRDHNINVLNVIEQMKVFMKTRFLNTLDNKDLMLEINKQLNTLIPENFRAAAEIRIMPSILPHSILLQLFSHEVQVRISQADLYEKNVIPIIFSYLGKMDYAEYKIAEQIEEPIIPAAASSSSSASSEPHIPSSSDLTPF